MTRPDLFFDTSALFSDILSPDRGARALLILAQIDQINITISMQVTIEIERALSKNAPEITGHYRQILKDARIRILPDPTIEEIDAHERLITHHEDLPILTAAILCRTDYLVTHNSKHFIDNPMVAEKSGLRIGSPGEALAWVCAKMAGSDTSATPPANKS